MAAVAQLKLAVRIGAAKWVCVYCPQVGQEVTNSHCSLRCTRAARIVCTRCAGVGCSVSMRRWQSIRLLRMFGAVCAWVDSCRDGVVRAV